MFVINEICGLRIPFHAYVLHGSYPRDLHLLRGSSCVSVPRLSPQVWDLKGAPSHPLCLTTAELKVKALLRLIKLFACYSTG